MFGVNSISQIGDIVEGHYKELTKQENDLYTQRIAICKTCPLYSVVDGLGEICDPKKCWNEKEQILETYPSNNNICGCACRLAAKTRVKHAKCVLSKWTI